MDAGSDAVRFVLIPLGAVLAASLIRAIAQYSNGQRLATRSFSTVWLDLTIAGLFNFAIAVNDVSHALDELGFSIKDPKQAANRNYFDDLRQKLSSIQNRALAVIFIVTLAAVLVAILARTPRAGRRDRFVYRILLPYLVASVSIGYSLWQGGQALHLIRLVPMLPK